MSDTAQKTAILSIPGMDPIELPILKGTLGPEVIDIRALGSHGYFTYDPGFVSTASCKSHITFICLLTVWIPFDISFFFIVILHLRQNFAETPVTMRLLQRIDIQYQI